MLYRNWMKSLALAAALMTAPWIPHGTAAAAETAGEAATADYFALEYAAPVEEEAAETDAENIPVENAVEEKNTVEETTEPDCTALVLEDSLGDGEELYEQYLRIRLYGDPAAPRRARRVQSAGSRLTGLNRSVYDVLKSRVTDIADGKSASSVISIPVYEYCDQVEWTSQELGLSTIYNEQGKPSEEARRVVRDKVGYSANRVVEALIADSAYALYWYDKTVSYSYINFSFLYVPGEERLRISPNAAVTFKLPVAKDYRLPGADTAYEPDPEKTGRAFASVQRAREIVEQAAQMPDPEKLRYFKEQICSLVSYDFSAAGDGREYGDAWQIIHVFDGDASTNVVCEGYAKAFQYLCDLSDFSGDIRCITVSGKVIYYGKTSLDHMWNLVQMEDGNNYLVDVTNCDAGTIGAPDVLFLAGGASVDGGYKLMQGNIQYLYDELTKRNFGEEDLLLSGHDYGENPAKTDDTDKNVEPGKEDSKAQEPQNSSQEEKRDTAESENSGRGSRGRSDTRGAETAAAPGGTGNSSRSEDVGSTSENARSDEAASTDNSTDSSTDTVPAGEDSGALRTGEGAAGDTTQDSDENSQAQEERSGMSQRLICIIIGYLFGMFLTAEVITRKMTGKPCSELGTSGNPGMANVMANLGFKPGLAVLLGDVTKTALAAGISYWLAGSALGRTAILYAGLGVTLGHNYPAWNRFKGGKGVATTCAALLLFSLPWGAAADLAGLAGVLLSKYLCIGALVIPIVFAGLSLALWGTETFLIALALALLMAVRHIPDVLKIRDGSVKQIDLAGKIRSKLQKFMEEQAATGTGQTTEEGEEQPDAGFMALAGTGVDGMEHRSDDLVREHITFYGRVQGVGFRYQASYAARAFGVTGWVENMPDGSVEMEAQGTLVSIGKMLTRLQEGSWIRIDQMVTSEQALVKGESGFKVRGY